MAKTSKLVIPRCWWKHMDFMKRIFWKKERRAYKAAIRKGEL